VFRCWDHIQGRLKHPTVEVCILMRVFEKQELRKYLWFERMEGGVNGVIINFEI